MTTIALLRDSTFLELPTGESGDSASDAFRARWLASTLRYRLFANGIEFGALDSLHPEEPACTGLAASGRWVPLPNRVSRPLAVATNLRRLQSRPALSHPSGSDSAWLTSYATRLLADSGLKSGSLAHQSVVAIKGAPTEAPALIGIFAAVQREPFTFENETQDLDFVYGVIIAAESLPSGYRANVLLYAKGAEADLAHWELYDALDLIGDSQPEVIVRGDYYESYDYLIYTRTPAGWVRVYAGGGAGC